MRLMLKIIRDYKDLDVGKLTAVYSQSNQEKARKDYPDLSPNLQILEAEQDFYDYLKFFLSQNDAYYALWCHQSEYLAAVRVEPYLDGFLLSGLETAPNARNRGCATNLLQGVQSKMKEFGIYRLYSHVCKDNPASIAVHQKCGFRKISDESEYIDGTKDDRAYTYLFEI